MFGLLYQPRLESRIESGGLDIDCVEIQAEHFYQATPHHLRWLSSRVPIIVRSTSLSFAGPDALDEGQVARCVAIVRDAKGLWLAHPLGFSRAGEIDLGLNMPIAPTVANLDLAVARAAALMERSGVPLLIEPNASRLRLHGPLAETEFLGRLCGRSGSQLLLDIGALSASARTHGFAPAAWLDDVDADLIVEIRIGATAGDNREAASDWAFDQQLALLRHVLRRARPRAFVLAPAPSWPVTDVQQRLSTLRALAA